MAKQYYFSVCVEEDGTAWIDSEIAFNGNNEDVWNPDASEWESHTTDENSEPSELAFERLSATLNTSKPIEKETMFSTSEPTPSRGKHAGHYSLRHDLSEAKDTLFEQMGQDLDTWQLIARDLARDIVRGYGNISDAQDFARDILTRLSHLPEMNIHPSELGDAK